MNVKKIKYLYCFTFFTSLITASTLGDIPEYSCNVKPEKGYFSYSWVLFFEKKDKILFLVNPTFERWITYNTKAKSSYHFNGKQKIINSKIYVETKVQDNYFYVLSARIKHHGKFEAYHGKLKLKGYHRRYKLIKNKKVLERKVKLDIICLPPEI